MVTYAYAALAAILTGRSDLQIFFYLFGPGGTGKSTFLRLATALVGQSNTYTTTLKALEEGQFETACLYGMRLVVINDAGKYGKAVDNLKAATGEDWLRNERKHVQQSQRSQFIYRGMVLIASNVRFTSTDQTSGIERRQRSIDMENVVSEAQKAAWREQGGEESVLHAEIPGLVNRLLKMPREEVARILNNPPRKAARSDFEALLVNNHVARWMVGCCAPDPKHHGVIGQSRELRAEGGRLVQEHKELHLYPSFLMFCAEERIQPFSRSRFKATVLDMARSLGHPVENKPAPGLNVDSFSGIRLLGQYESRYRWHDSIRDEEIEVPPNPFD
ncbi:DUF5906 domain-containing protein [Aromatoleum anaerobium]|uniref:SF3 helicase domain-containing protein n=1 Tax=Aromatoleum anaerobium TaxID=182180 RepID=A0ABX1PPV4_9RHOO|nr:DUF5906 domain-containing protein [Aromatoleum anaerobium]MCK0506332.1 DUF5906 domain-containing protein [Aromatoleum anaerobium]